MRFVIDTNIIISAIIKNSVTRDLLLYSNYSFFYPKISFSEIEKHKKLILKKAKINEEGFWKIVSLLCENITFVETSFFENDLHKAKQIMEEVDIDDSVFLALALSLEDCKIWSDDKDFEKQDRIEIIKTGDLIKKYFKKS